MKRALIVALFACFVGGTLPAAIVEFTVDPSRSFVTVLGAIQTDSFQPVRPGSSTSQYFGSFYGSIVGDALTIGGGNPRTYELPGGPELPPAYELRADTFQGPVTISILSIGLSAASSFDAEPFSISEGRFPGHLVRFFIEGGTIIYTGFGSGPQQLDLHGRGAPNMTQQEGTISTANGFQTITVPLHLAFPFSLENENDTILTFSGQFVATRPVPEPNTALTLIIGASVLLARARGSARAFT